MIFESCIEICQSNILTFCDPVGVLFSPMVSGWADEWVVGRAAGTFDLMLGHFGIFGQYSEHPNHNSIVQDVCI